MILRRLFDPKETDPGELILKVAYTIFGLLIFGALSVLVVSLVDTHQKLDKAIWYVPDPVLLEETGEVRFIKKKRQDINSAASDRYIYYTHNGKEYRTSIFVHQEPVD